MYAVRPIAAEKSSFTFGCFYFPFTVSPVLIFRNFEEREINMRNEISKLLKENEMKLVEMEALENIQME